METDTRSSLGQSASETEEDTVSISKKEVCDGTCPKDSAEMGLVHVLSPTKRLADLQLSPSPLSSKYWIHFTAEKAAAPGCTVTYLLRGKNLDVDSAEVVKAGLR